MEWPAFIAFIAPLCMELISGGEKIRTRTCLGQQSYLNPH